jgi:hypothetical protein
MRYSTRWDDAYLPSTFGRGAGGEGSGKGGRRKYNPKSQICNFQSLIPNP